MIVPAGTQLQARLPLEPIVPPLPQPPPVLVDPRASSKPDVMVEYVVGLMFDLAFSHVVLLEKQKPAWQKGKLNGPGGGLEANETPVMAMTREFYEETGVHPMHGWRQFARGICGNGTHNGRQLKCVVHYLMAVETIGEVRECRTTTAETVGLYSIDELQGYTRCCPRRMMTNLHWLIPMAMTMSLNTAKLIEFEEKV